MCSTMTFKTAMLHCITNLRSWECSVFKGELLFLVHYNSGPYLMEAHLVLEQLKVLLELEVVLLKKAVKSHFHVP